MEHPCDMGDCVNVKVRAATMEEAMEIAKDEDWVISLLDEADYVDIVVESLLAVILRK